ncbi:DUF2510 domain-containing protein [Antiquaquibacter soli]|uniref:DUF2510 domain-containing protein n=1 Tax=Antiquaquibacter soli TaxID=3064523 RepID=A0ABT9BMU3_9MICO|nr:DUF2510 domain-containing protein [Protaetiibacter sp. WY-16]MDO7882351.1 DUF2510 domain-containing protein [Protaetiibacter sp. WY-16]
MSGSTPLPPAGWYPDPAGTPRARWWDGTAWTDTYQQPLPPAAPRPVLVAPAGTNPTTPWIWVIVVTAAAVAVVTFLSATGTPTTERNYLTVGDLMTVGAVLVGSAVHTLSAWLDYRSLTARGVPRPFHWAWMLFSLATPLVYVIGRFVVLGRRGIGTGMLPLWITSAIAVVSFMANGVAARL